MPPRGQLTNRGKCLDPSRTWVSVAVLHALFVASFKDWELMCLQPPGRNHAFDRVSSSWARLQVLSASLPLPQGRRAETFLREVRSWNASVVKMFYVQACMLETPSGGEVNSMMT